MAINANENAKHIWERNDNIVTYYRFERKRLIALCDQPLLLLTEQQKDIPAEMEIAKSVKQESNDFSRKMFNLINNNTINIIMVHNKDF